MVKTIRYFLHSVARLSLIVKVVLIDALLFVPMIVFSNVHDFAK